MFATPLGGRAGPGAIDREGLLPKPSANLSTVQLVVATARLHLERWRFNYGRKLTPSRICDFPVSITPTLHKWSSERIEAMGHVVSTALQIYDT